METNVIKKRMQRLIVAILTMALVLTAFTLMPVASQIANPDSDSGVAYAAAKKVKVTYKANGGKFTAKKYAKKKSYSKKINKGKKIGTLPKIKRSGYTLKGWYTKKSGGKKVTKNTKIKKNTTYYAQWKKNRVLTTEEKKLVGVWLYRSSTLVMTWNFFNDGTFYYSHEITRYGGGGYATGRSYAEQKGTWTLKNNVMATTYQKRKKSGTNGVWEKWETSENGKYFIVFDVDEYGRQYFRFDTSSPISELNPALIKQ